MQAAHEEAGADEQQYGQRALNHEQRRPRPRALIRTLPDASLERRRERCSPGLQARHESGQQPGDERSGASEDERSRITHDIRCFAFAQEQ